MKEKKIFGRRRFIENIAKAGIVGMIPAPAVSKQIFKSNIDSDNELFLTLPYLQNLKFDGVTIMWLTGKPTKNWVEYGMGDNPDQQAASAHLGLVDGNDMIHKIRLNNLKADTHYCYRVCSQEIIDFQPYNIQLGEIVKSEIYHFVTPKVNPDKISWVVLNDIHDRPASFPLLMSLIKDFSYDFVYLNGDMFDFETDQQQMIDHLLKPLGNLFSTQTPFIFARGNHETRGKFARNHALYFENPTDRYYFSFTFGPVHFIVLDTGEDKEDSVEVYKGLAAFDAYREEQAAWLAKEIKTDAFLHAPFRVAMIHIPTYEAGDWHGTMHCRQVFDPLFNQGKIDLLICGHTHKYGTYLPDPETHHYPLIIGGGPLVSKRTVMTLQADRKELKLRMLRDDGVQVGALDIKSRR